MPKAKPPVALPATRPMTGAQRRHAPRKRSPAAIMMARVTPAVTGAAAGDAPSGTSLSFPRKVEARLTGISISTVPATAGVNTLRPMRCVGTGIPLTVIALRNRTNQCNLVTGAAFSIQFETGKRPLHRRRATSAGTIPARRGNPRPGSAEHGGNGHAAALGLAARRSPTSMPAGAYSGSIWNTTSPNWVQIGRLPCSLKGRQDVLQAPVTTKWWLTRAAAPPRPPAAG